MKTTLFSNKPILALFILAAGGFALGMGWLERGASAVADSETQFGMVGLEAGQSLRFNTLNATMGDGSVRVTMKFDIYSLGGPDTAPGCSPGGAVAACTNNLRWLKTESCRVTLRSRAAAVCEFTSDRAGLVVDVSTLVENMGPGVKVLPSVEVRENNRTVFVHPGVARGFNPQPDPPLEH